MKDFFLATLSHKHALDIHEGNVLFCIPPTLELRADSFKPVAYDVIKYDGGPLEEGVPRHYVESMTYEGQNCEELVDVQLVDFSNSRVSRFSIICTFINNILQVSLL